MAATVILFASAASANRLVAGIPAAARAVDRFAETRRGDAIGCIVAVPGGWQPTRWCLEELARLAPAMAVEFRDVAELGSLERATVFNAAALIARGHAIPADADELAEHAEANLLEAASHAIIAATGKAGDGIVSRFINRPVSRFITRQVLRLPRVVPLHGTVATGVTGLAMAVCLLSGSVAGLVAGAILFQAASIIDGVDGEIARATQRSSRLGATLDSVTDGLTNLGFIFGITANLWMRGETIGAAAGLVGVSVLALGLSLLALRSVAIGQPVNFEAVKTHFRASSAGSPSGSAMTLTRLTSRDFYAAAFALVIPLGFAEQALLAFGAAAVVWFLVVAWVLFTTAARQTEHY